MRWPWKEPKDEPAPCTSLALASDPKKIPSDSKDHEGVPRAHMSTKL